MIGEQKIQHVISEALDNLFAAQFLSMHDYNELIASGQLVRKGKYVDDRAFYKANPGHPLAGENRHRRIDAADTIRDQAAVLQNPLPVELLDKLYPALFDCCAAVRHSLAHALFYCGVEQSAPHLEKLLEEETESKMVREYTTAALERCLMRGLKQLPEGKKVIMLVSKDIQLYIALQKLAEREDTYLYMPQHNYSELIAWSSATVVQIIDRLLMGQDNWESFCDYLEDINQTGLQYPIRDESGEVLFEEPIYDHTPLITIDANLRASREKLRNPNIPSHKNFGVEGGSIDLVTKLVMHILHENEIDFYALANECNEGR
jgi:hypothetical protein